MRVAGLRFSARRGARARVEMLAAGFCLLLALLALPPRAAAQGDVLYGALVLATNADHPEPVPEELRSQAANLRTVFGYNQFRLLGQKRKAVPTGTEDWLVSSPQFFLRVDTKHPVPGGYAVNLQLLKENKVLVEADTNLERNRPLFIRGPFVGQGQLIILLMVL
jgi:hypothetical protein